MTKNLTISLDAMGGDNAPRIVIEGADLLLADNPDVKFILFGDEAELGPLLDRYRRVRDASRVVHTEHQISMEDKPSQMLRKGRRSSMWLAIKAVKDGEADAIVSAGNTGALMVLARRLLSTLPGIDRPAIAALWPSRRGRTVALDMGANVEASAKELADFAVLGAAFAHSVLNIDEPKVAILNVGAEELKGHEDVRGAAAILRRSDLGFNYVGFVEGDDIALGTADVVVTDGFTGNLALKAAEGIARLMTHYIREAFKSSLLGKLAAVIASRQLKVLKQQLNPGDANGGVFLGLNGVVVKSHGGADGPSFASAIELALRYGGSDFATDIAQSISHLHIGAGTDDEIQDGQDTDRVHGKEVVAQ